MDIPNDPRRIDSPAHPAHLQVPIVPDDVEVFTATRGVYVGTGGDLTVLDARGNEVTYRNLGNGSSLPIAITAVKTSTTCADLVGWW